MSRDQAEKKLDITKDGLFLVRESNNFPGDYTLCVRYGTPGPLAIYKSQMKSLCYNNVLVHGVVLFISFDKKVEHYRVILKNNRVTVDEEEYFENLVKLVEVSKSFGLPFYNIYFFGFDSIIKKKLMVCVQDYVHLLIRKESMKCVLIWMPLRKVLEPLIFTVVSKLYLQLAGLSGGKTLILVH